MSIKIGDKVTVNFDAVEYPLSTRDCSVDTVYTIIEAGYAQRIDNDETEYGVRFFDDVGDSVELGEHEVSLVTIN